MSIKGFLKHWMVLVLFIAGIQQGCIEDNFQEQVFANAITGSASPTDVNEVIIFGRIEGIEGQINAADYPVREYGFVLSTSNTEPTLQTANTERIIVGTDYANNQEFEAPLSNRSIQSIYFYRAYLILGERISYGDVATFSLAENVALAMIDTISIENDEAILEGALILKFQGELEDHGFVFSKTNDRPSVETDSIISFGATNNDGIFSGRAINLDLNSTYYVRSFAQLGSDIFYSGAEAIQFQTRDGWKNYANLNRPRLFPLGLAVNDLGYIGLGCDFFCLQNDAETRFNTIFEFDPSLGQGDLPFIEKTAGPPGRRGGISLVIGEKIYYGLGQYNNDADGSAIWLNDFWEFDPAGNGTWTQMDDFPGEARQGAVGFSLNADKGYIGTGKSSNGFSHFGDFWAFYPENQPGQQWDQLSGSLPTDLDGSPVFIGRTQATAFVLNDQAYVTTGEVNGEPLKDIWRFNESAESWARASDLPEDFLPRSQAISFSLNEKIYLGLGQGKIEDEKRYDLWEFSGDDWIQKMSFPKDSLNLPRFGFRIGDRAYAGGQNDLQGLLDVIQYTPEN